MIWNVSIHWHSIHSSSRFERHYETAILEDEMSATLREVTGSAFCKKYQRNKAGQEIVQVIALLKMVIVFIALFISMHQFFYIC